MNISQMYINPALVMMFLAMLGAFIGVGSLLWKLAQKLATMDTKIELKIDGLERRMTSVEQTFKARSS